MSPEPLPKAELIALGEVDVEQQSRDTSYLDNRVVKTLAWSDVTVVVPDRETKLQRKILSAVSGHVAAGKTHSQSTRTSITWY
jgi:hypothetical protein